MGRPLVGLGMGAGVEGYFGPRVCSWLTQTQKKSFSACMARPASSALGTVFPGSGGHVKTTHIYTLLTWMRQTFSFFDAPESN